MLQCPGQKLTFGYEGEIRKSKYTQQITGHGTTDQRPKTDVRDQRRNPNSRNRRITAIGFDHSRFLSFDIVSNLEFRASGFFRGATPCLKTHVFSYEGEIRISNIEIRNKSESPKFKCSKHTSTAPICFGDCRFLSFDIVSDFEFSASRFLCGATPRLKTHVFSYEGENPNIKYRNTKQINANYQNSNHQNPRAPRLYVSVIAAFCHSILFRISSFVLRVSSAVQRLG